MRLGTPAIVSSMLLAGCLGQSAPVGTQDGFDPGTPTGKTDMARDASVAGVADMADMGDPLNYVQDPLDPSVGFLTGSKQLALLCSRNNGDAVSKAFCASATPPTITSIVDLQKLVGLAFQAGNIANGTGGNPAFTMTGHSSSLVTRFTSPINPRAIIFTPPITRGRTGNNPKPLASFVAMGFVRGEQFVELVSNDPTANAGAGDLNFFLFRFTQACNATATGCTVDDLLTPKVESGYTSYSLYQDVDIKDTIFDCLQCHQTTGPGTAKILRQQELQNPWGHFFRNNRSNGEIMLADFAAAHGKTETYAGIPGAVIFNANTTNNNGAGPFLGGGPDPAALEGLVENQGFKTQPNEFSSGNLLDKGESAGWETLYDNAKTALDIPPPYHENLVTDPTLLATATTDYAAAIANNTPLTTDIRDIFLASAYQDLTFRPSADLVTANNGLGIMVQICQQCHNPSLDQTVSRAKFDVTKLATMDPAEKQKAILRLNLPDDVFRKMPPPRFRDLAPNEIALVNAALSQ
jgi:mono/diheme cytochrome c family protein